MEPNDGERRKEQCRLRASEEERDGWMVCGSESMPETRTESGSSECGREGGTGMDRERMREGERG